MPNITTCATPDIFRTIRGVKVFHTYTDDDMDQGVMTYWFTLNSDSDEEHFDVRILNVPSRKLMDAHPPFKTDVNPVWAKASASERASIDHEWALWHSTGEPEVIAMVIDEALAAGLLKLPAVETSVDDGASPAEIKVQVTEICSDQEWTADPDMIEVSAGAALLESAERCVAFMQENDINYMCKWWAFSYTLYKVDDDSDAQDKPKIIGTNGQAYVEFEPEYRLNGCNAKIYKDGDIQAVLPFKHSDGELWFDVGNVADLKFQLECKPRNTVL